MFFLSAVCTLIIPFLQTKKEWIPPRTMSRRESQAIIKARNSTSEGPDAASRAASRSEESRSESNSIEEKKDNLYITNEAEEKKNDDVFMDENNKKNLSKSDTFCGPADDQTNDVVDQYVWVV